MKNDNNKTISLELATQIKETREKKNLTQAEVAKQAEVTETFYAMIERCETNPSVVKLNRILHVLGLKLVATEQ